MAFETVPYPLSPHRGPITGPQGIDRQYPWLSQYLSAQRHRDDAIGDLAREFPAKARSGVKFLTQRINTKYRAFPEKAAVRLKVVDLLVEEYTENQRRHHAFLGGVR